MSKVAFCKIHRPSKTIFKNQSKERPPLPTMATELTTILLESQSQLIESLQHRGADVSIRRLAEQKLISAEQNNFSAYVDSLSKELASENRPPLARQLAGIVLKNAISGMDPVIDKLKREKWVLLPTEISDKTRESVLATLTSPCEEARSAACQFIAKAGRLDLAINRWSNLLPTLMQLVVNKEAPPFHRRSATVAVGYLSEDISNLSQEANISELLKKEQKDTILTTVMHAMSQTDDTELTLAGCKAFYHALLFANDNLVVANERSFIFSTVAQCLKHSDLRIQQSGWECVLQIASEYYPFLDNYAADLGQHSIRTVQAAMQAMDQPTPDDVKSQTEAVALAALEYWNTICDVEITTMIREDEEETPQCKYYIRQAKVVLLPVLFEAMTKQEDEEARYDLEEWTLAMAAGTCVGLCAQVLGDDILEPALQFVNANFGHENWKRREAAVLAYGSIMEGPSSPRLEPLVQQSFTHLCNALNDQSVAVRDTTAWTIGRIASFHPNCVIGLLGTPNDRGLMMLLLEKLSDEPRVASFVCYTLHELGSNISKVSGASRLDKKPYVTPLDPFFPRIASALLQVTQQSTASQSQLRQSAFEAIGEVVNAVGDSDQCFATMVEVLRTLILWLNQSFSQPQTEELFQYQGSICGCLNNVVDRLEVRLEALNVADQLFTLFLRAVEAGLIASAGATTAIGGVEGLGSSEERAKVGSEEDAIIAIGTLVRNAPDGVERHITELTRILLEGLKRSSDVRFCRACIGVICEIACTMDLRQAEVKSSVEKLVPELYRVLKDSSAPISLKPPLISTVGDLAVGMQSDFEPFLEPFLVLLGHAASTQVAEGPQSDEWVEYFQDLRDSVLEAFSGIVHGLRDCDKLHLLKPYVNSWLSFIQTVVEDRFSSISNISKATEVTGDLVMSYKSELVTVLVHLPFYKVMLEKGQSANDEDFKRHTLFLKNAVVRCVNK